MLKKLFHIFNSLLVILYLFPGSIIGYFLYRDFSQQPQLTSDFLSFPVSWNIGNLMCLVSLYPTNLGNLSFPMMCYPGNTLFFYSFGILEILEISFLIFP